MSDGQGLRCRFWGVRGSIACGGPSWQRYGGNTSCLEVRCGDRLVVLDAGTGLRVLGASLQPPIDADVLLTHTHVDHIEGIPFFRPFFHPQSVIRIHSGHLQNGQTLHQVLAGYMAPPLFPVPPSIFAAQVTYNDLGDKTPDLGPDIGVKTAVLNHPNGAIGYRLTYRGRSLCYVTDTEHVVGQRDQAVLDLIRGADVLIYDATFTDEEYPKYVGWGHSTWQEGVRLCDEAEVGTFVVFHHDPNHDDEAMDQIAAAVAEARPGSLVAREGMVLHLPPDGPLDVTG